MLSGFLGTLIYEFECTKLFQKYKKYGNIFNNYYFYRSQKTQIGNVDLFLQKTGTEHDEDLSNQVLEILHMEPISTRRHEIYIW